MRKNVPFVKQEFSQKYIGNSKKFNSLNELYSSKYDPFHDDNDEITSFWMRWNTHPMSFIEEIMR